MAFVVFNANGREISTYDSQGTKFAAREFARSGSITLDRTVSEVPALGQRPAFGLARDGHWRPRYPPLAAVLGGGVGWLLGTAGVLDLDAPLAPAIISKVTASCLTAFSVVLVFLTAGRFAAGRSAPLVAAAFCLGTGAWSTLSQTLWQSEIAVPGTLLALYALQRDSVTPSRLWRVVAFGGLALVIASRWQMAPTVCILSWYALRRTNWRQWWTAAPLVAAAGITATVNYVWFGNLLGGAVEMELRALKYHLLTTSFNGRFWEGLTGLLVSPSRGLLVFSPIVLVSLGRFKRLPELARYAMVAAAVHLVTYATYSTWWGGHTYGPRYALEVLPLLVPAAATRLVEIIRRPVARLICLVALTWSVATAGAGAFVYPAERWNTHPGDVDHKHGRLWDWRDMQAVRCWRTSSSPQNFALFDAEAWRPQVPARSAGSRRSRRSATRQ